MKIISGSLKGRNILGYDILGTRPTMDRVKESIFGMIQNYLTDALVLDLFAGSGNYGIEALSNGATKAYFNDYNKKCVNIIKDNITNFGIINKCYITNLPYQKALDYYFNNHIQFDLIFLDPPYKDHCINKIIQYISDKSLLKDKGLIICEFVDENLDDNYNDLQLIKERKYGDKKVYIYQNLSANKS